jgi:predicted 3-demethylubiquinone-9 3-methyltransferase (glyoxalase superfamily)
MQKIVPHLWFDKGSRDAAEFYVRAFGGDSRVTNARTLTGTPSGDVETVSFRLRGYEFAAISAGPLFTINPSISFFVNFDPSRDVAAREHIDELWKFLSDGGTPLMPLDTYPFSERYGWIQDRYGVSWQLILTNPGGEPRPDIAPSLLFVGGVTGKAEEAMKYYTGTFGGSRIGNLHRYGPGHAPDKDGSVMFGDFMLEGGWFAAMDSAHPHGFSFNEALSFMVFCDSQEEIDRFWQALSARSEAEQCGWCKDQFGVSWQVVPAALNGMLSGSPEQRNRVTKAFLQMKKFDIRALEKAYRG